MRKLRTTFPRAEITMTAHKDMKRKTQVQAPLTSSNAMQSPSSKDKIVSDDADKSIESTNPWQLPPSLREPEQVCRRNSFAAPGIWL